MTKKLENLIVKRAALLSMLENAVFDLMEICTSSVEIDSELVEAQFQEVKMSYKEFSNNQKDILMLGILKEEADEGGLYMANKTTVEKARKEWLSAQETFSKFKKQQDSWISLTSSSGVTTPRLSSKLENLPVPTWQGERKTYAGWKSSFVKNMTKHSQDKDEQLQRLKKAISGEWGSRIENCNSIEDAWEILDLEFKNKEKLIEDIYNEIRKFRVKYDARGLSNYADAISDFIRHVKDAGEPQEAESRLLITELREKLCFEYRRNFFRDMMKEKKEENAKNLVEWLRAEALLLSRCPPQNSYDSSHKLRSHANDIKDENVEPEKKRKCYQCKNEHNVWECEDFMGLPSENRWDLVKKLKLCHKCFSKTHFAYDCKSKNCGKCTRRHHELLCTSTSNSQTTYAIQRSDSGTIDSTTKGHVQEGTGKDE